MPVPIAQAAEMAPYAVPGGETNLDTVTANAGLCQIVFTLTVTGTVAQIQADWATVLATNLSSPSAVLAFQS